MLLILATFFWSGNFFFGKLAYNNDLSPFKLSFFRWLMAFFILFPFTINSIYKNINILSKNKLLIIIVCFLYTFDAAY